MKKMQRHSFAKRLPNLAVALLLTTAVLTVGGCSGEKPLPEINAKSVVEKFYEYVSEAKIRGGKLLLHEAYKLTSGDQSRFDKAKFMETLAKYPSGFKVDIVKSEIRDRHAEVTIAYKMASMFGDAYSVSTVIPLNVDEETNTWKIDFKGDTDDQDLDTIRASYESEQSKAALAKVVDK